MNPLELQKGEFTLSTDPARLDLDMIVEFLQRSYWAQNRSRETIEKSIRNSLAFGIYQGSWQIGFARAVTDLATFAYIADVFVLEEFRRRGLARWLVTSILDHPDLKYLRRWFLATRDMHELYRRCGFVPLANPEIYMEILRENPGPAVASSLATA